jgi:hypothetical protein
MTTRRSAEPEGTGSPPATAGKDKGADQMTRLTVNLSPEVAQALKNYTEKYGVSYTEAVRRALGVLAFVDESKTRGASVYVKEGRKTTEVVFM